MKKFKYEILVFIFAILIKLPNLGYDTFNTDVWKWKSRSYNFSNGVFGLDFKETLQIYHPGVILMWHGTFAIKIFNLYYDVAVGGEPLNDVTSIFYLNFVQKLLVSITVAFCLAISFYLLKNLFGKKFAAFGVAMLLFEPLFLALTREFHLEGLMSAFMLVALFATYYYKTTKGRKALVVSALFTALAVLTKVTAVLLLPFIFGAILWASRTKDMKLKVLVQKTIRPCLSWFGVFLVFCFLMWPALWVRPLDVYNKVARGIFSVGIEEGHDQIYFGKYVSDPGATFYPVALLVKSSVFLVPGLIGYYLWARKKASLEVRHFNTFLLVFSIYYLLPLVFSSKKLDRYVLPSLLSLVLISTSFYYYLLKYKANIFYKLVLPIFIIWLGFLAYIHPDYLSYYSPFTGGLRNGITIIEPKWMYGGLAVQDYFKEVSQERGYTPFTKAQPFNEIRRKKALMADKLTVAFPEKYYNQTYPFILQIGGKAIIDKLTDEAQQAKFFVFPVWEDRHEYLDKHKLRYFDSIYVRGVKSFNVYERVGNP